MVRWGPFGFCLVCHPHSTHLGRWEHLQQLQPVTNQLSLKAAAAAAPSLHHQLRCCALCQQQCCLVHGLFVFIGVNLLIRF